jgi:multicomponent Na+:H+ antiporter subunit F
MTAELFLLVSENIGFALLALALAFTLLRLLRGPSLPDRILALDMLTLLSVSLAGLVALRTGVYIALDIALALCLVGFVATVALARFAATRATGPDDRAAPVTPEAS